MSRALLTIFCLGLVFSSGCAVNQQNCNSGCQERTHAQNFWYDFYRNKNWPMPFRAMDSQSVLSHFDIQRNNGWKLNNTVGTAMFDTTNCALNDSGRAHVKWIVTRAPQNRRVVFVLEGNNQQETAKRVEAVQIAISEFVPTGALPNIYLTDEDAPGSSGVYQTTISRAMTASVPEPRLPSNDAAGGGQ